MATIFDKILSGDIPSYKVYEDEHVYSFLDINPIALGHTLVIPREPRAFLHELSDESAASLGRALPRVARAVMAATGAENYNVLQNNGAPAHQAVFHVHFHIIPRIGDTGLGIGWKMGSLEGDVAQDLLARMHAALAADS
jgi:histidine triad (HIT) family protein